MINFIYEAEGNLYRSVALVEDVYTAASSLENKRNDAPTQTPCMTALPTNQKFTTL